MKTCKRFNFVPVILVIFVSLSLSCNLVGLSSSSDAPSQTNDISILEEAAVEDEPVPSDIEAGMSRQNPIKLNTLVSVPGWDIQVLEFLRGEAAAAVVNAGTRQFDPPPAGYEYALAYVYLRCTAMDENAHYLGLTELFIAGNNHIMYGDRMDGWPQPEFLFEDMFAAEAVEGWVDALIPVGETDLMLVLDISRPEPRITRFFELEPSASIAAAGESFNQVSNDIGANFEQPASLGEKLIMPEWDITVLSSVRGIDALALLQQDDPDFKGPDEGEEFILLNVLIHYFGRDELPESLSANNIYAQVEGSRYSGKIRYPRPTTLTWINNLVFPGAVVEGWTIVAVPAGLSNPVIVFNRHENNLDNPADGARFFTVP